MITTCYIEKGTTKYNWFHGTWHMTKDEIPLCGYESDGKIVKANRQSNCTECITEYLLIKYKDVWKELADK